MQSTCVGGKKMQIHHHDIYVNVLVYETNFQRCVIIVQDSYPWNVTSFLHHHFHWLKWYYFVLDTARVLWLVASNNGLLPGFNDTIALTCSRFQDENRCYTKRSCLLLAHLVLSTRHIILRATSHTRLKAHDHCNLRAFIGQKGGDCPSSLHTRSWKPKGPKKTSWMKSLYGVLHGGLWIRFHDLPKFSCGPPPRGGPDTNSRRPWFFKMFCPAWHILGQIAR